MDEKLTEMWSKLSLTEEEQANIVIENEWIEDTSSMGKDCLLGKVLLNKPVNIEAMRNVFMKIWKVKYGVTVHEVGERLFIFHFKDQTEKDRVFQKQPWSFNKALIVLQEVDGYSNINAVNMNWCPFRVQIHGLPLGLMNEKIGVVLGEGIGDVEEVITDEGRLAWGKYLTVKVSINISHPLKRGKVLSMAGQDKVLATFRYERLPNFCYVCGRLDHLEIDCDEVVRMKKEGMKIQRQYGPWMRAERPSLMSHKDEFPAQSTSRDSGVKRPTGRSMGNITKLREEGKSFKERRNKSLFTQVVEGEDQSMNSCSETRRRQDMEIRKEGGKVVELPTPETGAVEQLAPHTSGKSEKIFRKSKIDVGALADILDKNALTLNGMDVNQQHSRNTSPSDNAMRDITNGQLSPMKQGTWKRRVRYQVTKSLDGNKLANGPSKKRQLEGGTEKGVGKKKRDEPHDYLKIMESSQAEVGENQPRRSL